MCQQCIKQLKKQFSSTDTIRHGAMIGAFDTLPKCPAMKALEDLTPSGSEFVEEPKTCYTFVRERLDNQWKMLREKIIELNGLKLHKDDNLELVGRTCKHCGKQYNGTAFAICFNCGRFQ